jgi:hypothetical protein
MVGRPPIYGVAMTGAERLRRMRRLDRLREQARAALSLDDPGVRTRKLQQSTESWTRWIQSKVNTGSKVDTTAFLASALARTEQLAEDRTVALLRELVKTL